MSVPYGIGHAKLLRVSCEFDSRRGCHQTWAWSQFALQAFCFFPGFCTRPKQIQTDRLRQLAARAIPLAAGFFIPPEALGRASCRRAAVFRFAAIFSRCDAGAMDALPSALEQAMRLFFVEARSHRCPFFPSRIRCRPGCGFPKTENCILAFPSPAQTWRRFMLRTFFIRPRPKQGKMHPLPPGCRPLALCAGGPLAKRRCSASVPRDFSAARREIFLPPPSPSP